MWTFSNYLFDFSSRAAFANLEIPFNKALTKRTAVLQIKRAIAAEGIYASKNLKNIQTHLPAEINAAKEFNACVKLAESIKLSSGLPKTFNVNFNCPLNIKVTPVLPSASGVLSDMGILRTAADDTAFMNVLKNGIAWGFSGWRPYTPGEYYFSEMILRLNVENKDTGQIERVRVLNHKVSCDVDDLTDRGTVRIDPGYNQVSFNKKFHCTPTVNITPLNGNRATPVLMDVTEDGFTLILEHEGSPVAGIISYYAHGY